MIALNEGPKTYYIAASINEKNHEIIAALIAKLDAQKDNLKSAAALEHQNNVRKKYSEILSLVSHPVCYGFLLHFCEIQHCDENLSFIRAVDEYHSIFSADWVQGGEVWLSIDWRVIDMTVEIDNENINEGLLTSDTWISNLKKETVVAKIEFILGKYLRDDAQNQVCVSKSLIARTLKRVKLLYLYGPSVFDEACLDPILTMEKDVLPRFRGSNIVNAMIVRVASSEPVPPGRDLNVPPPENLLLHLCSAEAFPDTRCFTLDELIGCQHLYDSFFTFLQGISKEKADKLLCIRKIDIFEELMHMNCTKEATEEAWQIYRYYVAQGSAFEIFIRPLDRNDLMLSLAVPKRDMFLHVRQSAYLSLKLDYGLFVTTATYRGFPKLMRDLKAEAALPVAVVSLASCSSLPMIHHRSGREERDNQQKSVHKGKDEESDCNVNPKSHRSSMTGNLMSSLSIKKLRI